ncbi:MAG TPA: hypothetical protein VJX10_04370 [Pseudonocardiaceae bacterium]|nr:hypothetical protein [Pseudonocardiaceae bacterium]
MRGVVNRRVRRSGVLALLLLALTGCVPMEHVRGAASPAVHLTPTSPTTTTPTTTTPTTTTPPPTTTTTTSTPMPDFAPAVDDAVDAVSDGELSLAVYDRSSRTMVAAYHDERPYYTESVVKLLIGLDSLDHGGSTSRVTEMLERSDDGVATSLWDADGGRAIVTRMAAKIGLHHTTPPSRSGEWGDTRTTAGDLVDVYLYILDDAPAGERDVVVNALRHATNIAADGTDQYFGIPYAVGHQAPWAVKQGWACCEPGWVLNTTGLVGEDDQYIVIALTSHDTGGGSAVRRTDSVELTKAIEALLPDLGA